MTKDLEAYYGLPREVQFCKRCVMSNQRPNSTKEFEHTPESQKTTIRFDDDGICDACRLAEGKDDIDWDAKEAELLALLDKHRRTDGRYDCLVPGSGGKDSGWVAHQLKYKYGMNPLTVTWPPILYTDYGRRNFLNWMEVGGLDNISFNQNGRIKKLLTRLAIQNILHPFQPFILGQKNLTPKLAVDMDIPLIFYGENEAEWGNPIADNTSSLMDVARFAAKNYDSMYLGGVQIKEIMEKYDVSLSDLMPYLPIQVDKLSSRKVEVHYFGYYKKYTPQEAYYYSVENTGFAARPFRTQGTYSKYSSIDDKFDDLHYYTTFIKFGYGRATEDAAQEVRNKHLTREEGVSLIKRYDGEFPERYFDEMMEYIGMTGEEFHAICDKARSPHLWKKVNGEWKLRHVIDGSGTDD